MNPRRPGTRSSRQTSRQVACTKEEPRGRLAPGFRLIQRIRFSRKLQALVHLRSHLAPRSRCGITVRQPEHLTLAKVPPSSSIQLSRRARSTVRPCGAAEVPSTVGGPRSRSHSGDRSERTGSLVSSEGADRRKVPIVHRPSIVDVRPWPVAVPGRRSSCPRRCVHVHPLSASSAWDRPRSVFGVVPSIAARRRRGSSERRPCRRSLSSLDRHHVVTCRNHQASDRCRRQVPDLVDVAVAVGSPVVDQRLPDVVQLALRHARS